MNTKQTAMNIRRAKSQLTSKVDQTTHAEIKSEPEIYLIDKKVPMKSKGTAIAGGIISAVGVGVGIKFHTAYADKSAKNNQAKVVIKGDYFEEMALPLVIVLAGAYLMRLGLTFHDVEVKVPMTAEEHKAYLEEQKELAKKEKEAKSLPSVK